MNERQPHSRDDMMIAGALVAADLPASVPIVLFTASFELRGMERHVLQLAEAFGVRGHRVTVLCDDRDEIAELRSRLTQVGVEVCALASRSDGRMSGIRRFCSLLVVLRRHRQSVLHCHYAASSGGDLVLAAARLSGVRTIVRTEHNPPVLPVTRVQVARDRLRCSLYTHIIYVSESNRQEYLRHLGRKMCRSSVIFNGIDTVQISRAQLVADLRGELGHEGATKIVGVVSSLSEERKGIRTFLDAVGMLAPKHPSVGFVIVGDGALKTAFEEYARVLGVQDRVKFTGYRADVVDVLGALDVFVMASSFEGAPYAILEAMAMGCAVVSTPVGNVEELITDGTAGLIVPARDAHGLADAVASLLVSEQLRTRLGRNARDVVVRACSAEKMVDQVAKVYARATSSTKITGGPSPRVSAR